MTRITLEALFFMVIGYLMGSILYGYFLPKYLKKMDIEAVSADHNPGTANVMKHAGLPLGILCLILDIGKGYLPVAWAGRVVPPVNCLFAGIMAAPVVGHAYPFWKSGQGGKAIAVSFGVLLGVLRFSRSAFFLAAVYICLLGARTIRPNERKSVYSFMILGAVSAAALFFGQLPGICLGNILIALVVIRKNWTGAGFGQEENMVKKSVQ